MTTNAGIHSHYLHIPLNKYASHILHICSALLLQSQTNITLHIRTKTTNSNFYLPFYIHICASNKYAPQISHKHHIWQLLHVQIWGNYAHIYTSYIKQLCPYIYLIWTHCNQFCDQDRWYTCIWHYWHMSLKRMPTIFHIYAPLHFFCSLHIDCTLLHTSIKNKEPAKFIYQRIAKYVPPIKCPSNPYICHMLKVLVVH